MPSSRAHKQQKGAALARAQRAMRRQYADGGTASVLSIINQDQDRKEYAIGGSVKGLATPKSNVEKVLFLGENSATADRNALRRAQDMEAQGAPREQILMETGWFRDGEAWNYETDDRAFVGSEDGAIGRMEDFAPHSEAMAAYGNLGNIPIQPMFQGSDVGGSFGPTRFRLPWQRPAPGRMNYRPGMSQEDRTSTQLHELQHGVDLEEPAFKEYVSQSDPYHKQRMERRAFNVEMRRDLTPEQRRQFAPWETEPYAIMGGKAGRQTMSGMLAKPQALGFGPNPQADALNSLLAPDDQIVTIDNRKRK